MTKLRFLQLAIALMCVLFTGQPVAAQARHAAKPVVSILGDSYSTFEGYIPVGNAVWYDTRPNPKKTDVSDVKHTWWWQFISRGDIYSVSMTPTAELLYHTRDITEPTIPTVRSSRVCPVWARPTFC